MKYYFYKMPLTINIEDLPSKLMVEDNWSEEQKRKIIRFSGVSACLWERQCFLV